MLTITALQTARLTLTPVEPSMLTALHNLFINPSVRRYLLNDKVVGPDWVEDIITTSQRQFDETGYGLWAIQKTGHSALIGICGYAVFEQLQLLYALLPEYRGLGIATEAARAVVNYGFHEAGLTEIVAAADVPNMASFGVMKRLGMTYWKTDNDLLSYQLRIGHVLT